ncbi:hypothetical protein [Roseovarius aquimarinus]|uniref:Uncharacterized protein n=1 Tax=Roseovarius aquimarinus TaxID=1229156 RepID=A0ABW7IBB0_9RHOB
MREARITGRIEAEARFSQGIYFSADTSRSTVEIELAPLEGGLFRAEITVDGAPEWMSLNISLETGDFAIGDVIGIIADLRAPDPFDIHPFIRTDHGGTCRDTPLAETLTVSSSGGTSILFHPVAASDPLTDGAGFHTLVLPLPHRSLTFDLQDFRLLHVASGEGMPAISETLGSRSV